MMDRERREYLLKRQAFTDDELRAMATLHVAEITDGFLSSLGPAPLRLIYRAAAASPTSVLIAAFARDEAAVGGFICGTVDCAALYREFVKRNALAALVAFAPHLLSPGRLRLALETWRYPFRADLTTLPKAEILNFVVRPAHRGSGLAATLFASLVDELASRGVRQIKMVTGAAQMRAQRFYERVGARRAAGLRLHAERESVVYVYDLPGVNGPTGA